MRAKERLPRKHYSPEFKMELVRLALEEEGSIAALARKHDVNDNLLFKWIRLWQREGRVCRPRKNSSSLLPDTVQLQAGSSLP
ncbi:transposase, partial [Escherichia sp. E1130]|uniref:transposase n=1 Tax=Escherichia sp. E1130 TaxID=2041645 RepID=UPI001436795A